MQVRESTYWLWNRINVYRKRFLWCCLVGVLRVAASLSFVWTCKIAVDIATGKHQGNLYLWIVAMICIMILQIIFSNMATWQRAANTMFIANSLRLRLFDKSMNSDWTGKDRLHSGDTMNRLEEDVRVVSESVGDDIPQMLIVGIQLAAASVFLFVLQRDLLYVLLCIMPVALLSSKLYFKTMRKLTAEVRSKESQVQSVLQENLQNRLLVKAMGTLVNIVKMLDSKQQLLRGIYMHRLHFSTRSRVIVQLGFQAGYAVTFIWGVLGMREGFVTYGMMTAFLQLVNQVQRPIVDLSVYIPNMVKTLTSVERLKELDELPQENKINDILLGGKVGVRLENLSYKYPDNNKSTLNSLTFDFKPGTSTAIIGETGAGKSTLIRLMLSLLRKDSGKMTIYNDEMEIDIASSTRCNFMYVPQGNTLLSGTVRENLLLANPLATEEQMKKALDISAARFIYDKDGLETMCCEKGGGLSEGQAQRIAIARALIHPGSIIILDEASSALDSDTEAKILKSLMNGMKEKTIIWITHHGAVTQYMDQVLRIEAC